MADVLFVEYPKCSTCKKAEAWLDGQGIDYVDRDIVADNPTADELRTWHERSGLPLRRFFNTSGMLYREMELSKKLPTMTDDEAFALLATNGMLVKRPLLVTDATVIPGFKEEAWAAALAANVGEVFSF
ncbi:arsenate reductase family protein [uncultured Adlercreutzia sp.]|uniref:arsenate reductase family protein n=1 Tax=uncultured Adlercreutzia sp. TaxID=875803 RepID=UPI0026F3A686|nr:arsenate reductase family protein [uncultured Adlercreutzia sp.]